jgi:predicted DNA binding CopG/RHH family protein
MKKLNAYEKKIEKNLLKGEFVDVGKPEFEAIAQSLAARKKDAVLNIRINKEDLENIKRKAKKYGVRYQTLISELIHRAAG